jgi:hypothetical protein
MRPWYVRGLAALWSLWLVVVLTEPAGLAACPMHNGVMPAAPAAASAVIPDTPGPAATMPAPHHDHAAMQGAQVAAVHTDDAAAQNAEAQGADAQSAEAPAPSHDGHPCCTCLGACCMMMPAVMPASSITLADVTLRARTSPTPAYRTIRAARRVFAQPYAIGPPEQALS